MKKKDGLAIKGDVTITKVKADGTVETIKHHNLVVAVGLQYIAERMIDSGQPSEMSYMAIGTGEYDTAGDPILPLSGDDKLLTEVYRRPFTTNHPFTTGNTVTYQSTFEPVTGAPDYAMIEAGIFNAGPAADSGTMLCRTVFPVVTKEEGDTITITWDVTINPQA